MYIYNVMYREPGNHTTWSVVVTVLIIKTKEYSDKFQAFSRSV